MHVSIRIQGHLAKSWQEWLEGLEMVHEEEGTTRLCGTLPDQAPTTRVLQKLGRLHVTLLSLNRRETERGERS